jgi:hypothetical protein
MLFFCLSIFFAPILFFALLVHANIFEWLCPTWSSPTYIDKRDRASEASLSSDSAHNVIDLTGLAIVHVTVHRNARSHKRVLSDFGHVLLDRLILIVDVQEVDVSAGSTFG